MTRDVMLYQDVVFEHGDLVETVLFTHEHLALDGLAACQVFRFGDGVATAILVAPFLPALTLGFQPGRTLGSGYFD